MQILNESCFTQDELSPAPGTAEKPVPEPVRVTVSVSQMNLVAHRAARALCLGVMLSTGTTIAVAGAPAAQTEANRMVENQDRVLIPEAKNRVDGKPGA